MTIGAPGAKKRAGRERQRGGDGAGARPGARSQKTSSAIFISRAQHLILSYLPQNVTRVPAESLHRSQTRAETRARNPCSSQKF